MPFARARVTYSEMSRSKDPYRSGSAPSGCGKIFGPSTSASDESPGCPFAARKSCHDHIDMSQISTSK